MKNYITVILLLTFSFGDQWYSNLYNNYLNLFNQQSINIENRQTIKSFYYWRSTFYMSTNERQYLHDLSIDRLYVKFFDVDWNKYSGNYQVVAPIQFIDSIHEYQNIDIVPAVFITNRTLLNLNDENIDSLYLEIVGLIDRIIISENISINEVQIDCDWSLKTKNKYFSLLKKIKEYYNKKSITTSITLRLHQYKYPDITGVPPVSKCMLMFYNMGDINDLNEVNSIIDIKIAQSYLNNNDLYPIHIDVVLPIFSWSAIYRFNELVNLLNNVSIDKFNDNSLYKKIDSGKFLVIKNHYVDGVYLYNDDIIKIETVNYSQLIESAYLLSEKLHYSDISVAFFSLTENNIKGFTNDQINEIIKIFK